MEPENMFIEWCLEEYGSHHFLPNTDFYSITFTPAGKDLVLAAIQYVKQHYPDNYVGHMLIRLSSLQLSLQ